MWCRELDISDPGNAAEVLACQRARYAVEAELIGFDGIPPCAKRLTSSSAAVNASWGSYDPEELAGIVSWQKLADGSVDICRLVVAPRAYPRPFMAFAGAGLLQSHGSSTKTGGRQACACISALGSPDATLTAAVTVTSLVAMAAETLQCR
jgi:hypothetical protein